MRPHTNASSSFLRVSAPPCENCCCPPVRDSSGLPVVSVERDTSAPRNRRALAARTGWHPHLTSPGMTARSLLASCSLLVLSRSASRRRPKPRTRPRRRRDVPRRCRPSRRVPGVGRAAARRARVAHADERHGPLLARGHPRPGVRRAAATAISTRSIGRPARCGGSTTRAAPCCRHPPWRKGWCSSPSGTARWWRSTPRRARRAGRSVPVPRCRSRGDARGGTSTSRRP